MRLTLRRQFWLAIAAGVIAFGLLPIWGHESLCILHGHQSEQAQRSTTSKTNYSPLTQSVVIFPGAVYASQPSSESKQGETEKGNKLEHPWLCEAGITDMALVLFTYCLVVVGWVTMRSNEETVRDVESPQIALSWIDPRAANGRMVTNIGLSNGGRSSAQLKEWYIGFMKQEPEGRAPHYPRDIPHRHVRTNKFIPPNGPTPPLGQIWFDIEETPFIIGYFRYQDIFKRMHVSRICMRLGHPIGPDEPAGHPAWSEDS